MIDLVPLGPSAFLARFPTEAEARAWAESARGLGWPGVTEVVLAYRSAAVFADPDRADLDALADRLRGLEPPVEAEEAGRLVRLPVLYDGPDLPEVGDRLGLTVARVIAAHSGAEYRVFAVGFLPGFPYCGYLPAALSGLPRRAEPRPRVPSGSVAIVGRQTGVYPQDSPGGWHLLGRTPHRIVDLASSFFPLRAGDRLRFDPISPETFAALRGSPLPS